MKIQKPTLCFVSAILVADYVAQHAFAWKPRLGMFVTYVFMHVFAGGASTHGFLLMCSTASIRAAQMVKCLCGAAQQIGKTLFQEVLFLAGAFHY